MSIVKCSMGGCPYSVREGDRTNTYNRVVATARGTPRADGRQCWRCREGRTSHRCSVRVVKRLRTKARCHFGTRGCTNPRHRA